MIAALYVQTGGCYYGIPDVDPWDEDRDARRYRVADGEDRPRLSSDALIDMARSVAQ